MAGSTRKVTQPVLPSAGNVREYGGNGCVLFFASAQRSGRAAQQPERLGVAGRDIGSHGPEHNAGWNRSVRPDGREAVERRGDGVSREADGGGDCPLLWRWPAELFTTVSASSIWLSI